MQYEWRITLHTKSGRTIERNFLSETYISDDIVKMLFANEQLTSLRYSNNSVFCFFPSEIEAFSLNFVREVDN